MKPGFTMAEAVDVAKKIKMRWDRIAHLNQEMITIQDKIRIMEDEITDLEKLL
jgi:peptidoglycan hydrolase CwlO-like protein